MTSLDCFLIFSPILLCVGTACAIALGCHISNVRNPIKEL